MRWLVPIVLLFLVSCKNEKGVYPADICGDWIAVESNQSWIRFDSIKAIVNIHYNDQFVHDTCDYVYIEDAGNGFIPIEDESLELAIIAIRMMQDKPNMIAIGEDKDVEGLFTYTMVQGNAPR